MLGIWQFYGTQVDVSGFVKVLPNATVTVRRESDGGLAELEIDVDGSSPGLDNPFTAGSDGEIEFCADQAERYRIDIVSGALTLTLRHQSVSVAMSSFMSDLLQRTSIAAVGAMGVPLNFSLAVSVGSSALTIAVKGADGQDPSPTNPVYVPFRSGTGGIVWRTLTSALSLVIGSGSSLGHNSGLKQYTHVYFADNAGAVVLAVASKFFGWHGVASALGMSDSPDEADSGILMYAEDDLTDVAFNCVALIEDTQEVAGTWASAPSAVRLAPFSHPVISFSAHKNGTNQTGVATATDTKITFGTEVYDNGGLFDAATNHRWTPPPGSIELRATALIDASTADQAPINVMVFKNGTVFRQSRDRLSGTGSDGASVSIDDECNGTDYYEIFVNHETGGNQVINGLAIFTYVFGRWSPQRS